MFRDKSFYVASNFTKHNRIVVVFILSILFFLYVATFAYPHYLSYANLYLLEAENSQHSALSPEEDAKFLVEVDEYSFQGFRKFTLLLNNGANYSEGSVVIVGCGAFETTWGNSYPLAENDLWDKYIRNLFEDMYKCSSFTEERELKIHILVIPFSEIIPIQSNYLQIQKATGSQYHIQFFAHDSYAVRVDPTGTGHVPIVVWLISFFLLGLIILGIWSILLQRD